MAVLSSRLARPQVHNRKDERSDQRHHVGSAAGRKPRSIRTPMAMSKEEIQTTAVIRYLYLRNSKARKAKRRAQGAACCGRRPYRTAGRRPSVVLPDDHEATRGPALFRRDPRDFNYEANRLYATCLASAQRDQREWSAATSCSMSASECSGVGVMRSRSVFFGTVG